MIVLNVNLEERSEYMKVEQMAREGCSFIGLQHENVHSIIAACVDSFGQTLLIYPFMDEGILKMYLHEKRQSTVTFSVSLFPFLYSRSFDESVIR